MRFWLILTWLIIASLPAQAQGEGDHWIFDEIHLHFTNSGNTVIDTANLPSNFFVFRNASSISDCAGNLLFFSPDGQTIYNANYDTMQNGAGLKAHTMPHETCLIVPHPGQPNLYYFFSNHWPKGLHYSIVDMAQNNGLGAVTSTKNVKLTDSSTTDILQATKGNQNNYWVVTHGLGDSSFYAYEVTTGGIDTVPVTSQTGPKTGVHLIGSSKFSPKGNYLAVGGHPGPINTNNFDYAFLFDFNKTTGKVSNPLMLDQPPNTATQSVAFSPDGSLLYTGNRGLNPNTTEAFISQFSLQANAINNSHQVVGQATFSHLDIFIPDMQLTPNGRLLIYNKFQTYLSCIEQPNVQGPGCHFQDTCIDLSNYTNYLNGSGFNNFVAGIFNPSYQILPRHTCPGDTTLFTLNDTMGLDAIAWRFGEPSSGAANTSTKAYPTHQYSAPGTYAVQAIAHYQCTTDTLRDTVTIPPSLSVNLGPDTSLCPQDGPFTLNAAQQDTNATYLWQDGSTDSTFAVDTAGTYWVRVANRCDTLSDTIHVAAMSVPQVHLGPDTSLCRSEQLVLHAAWPGASHLWQDGSTDSTFVVNSAGTYHVAVSNKCGTARDTIVVQQQRAPTVALGPDTTICKGSRAELRARVSGSDSYLWRNGSTDSTRLVSSEGHYVLTAANTCGTASDTVAVSVHQPRPIELQQDTAICESDTLLLDAGPAASYRWQDGSVGRHHQVTEAGTYAVSITDAHNCPNADSVRITARGCAGELFIPNAFTPNRDELNDGFRVYGENVQSLHIRIFNRWGELVFESEETGSYWDGTYKGQPAPVGVYIYVVKAAFNDGSRITRQGSLTLMR